MGADMLFCFIENGEFAKVYRNFSHGSALRLRAFVSLRELLAEGSTHEFIQKITGLSFEEIEKL